jgi:hypothetical protein
MHMQILTDQLAVFAFLEKYNQAGFDPNANHVSVFPANDHLAFLLFCHDGVGKGAQICLLDSPPAPGELDNELLPVLLKLEGDHFLEQLREEAMECFRRLSLQKSNWRSFFDAH